VGSLLCIPMRKCHTSIRDSRCRISNNNKSDRDLKCSREADGKLRLTSHPSRIFRLRFGQQSLVCGVLLICLLPKSLQGTTSWHIGQAHRRLHQTSAPNPLITSLPIHAYNPHFLISPPIQIHPRLPECRLRDSIRYTWGNYGGMPPPPPVPQDFVRVAKGFPEEKGVVAYGDGEEEGSKGGDC